MKQIEKRKHRRVKTDIPLSFHTLPGSALGAVTPGVERAVSCDLSEGGARFFVDRFIPMSSRIVMGIDLIVPWKPIEVISRVAWIRKAASGDNYEIGVQFLQISKANLSMLSECVSITAALEG